MPAFRSSSSLRANSSAFLSSSSCRLYQLLPNHQILSDQLIILQLYSTIINFYQHNVLHGIKDIDAMFDGIKNTDAKEFESQIKSAN